MLNSDTDVQVYHYQQVLLSLENANLRLTDVLLVPEMRYIISSCVMRSTCGQRHRVSILK